MGGAVQVNSVNRVFVCIHHSFDSIALGVEDVTIEREAVVGLGVVGRDCCTETQSGDLFIGVVVLENVADGLDSV